VVRVAAWKSNQAGDRFIPYDARFADRIATIGYFTRDVLVLEDRWWGVQNLSLIRKHTRAVSGDEITHAIVSLFGRTTPRKHNTTVEPPASPQFTPRRLRLLREWVEADQKWD
jgi:hypothetical protein